MLTDRQRAIAYAAYKELEKLLKNDGELPPGNYNISGESLTIVLSETSVSRSVGEGGGFIYKKATQNLYGWSVWALFLKKLKAFNQAGAVKRILMEAWTESMITGETVEKELKDIDPELAAFTEELKKQPAPKRREVTPRKITKEADAQIIFSRNPQLQEAA